MSQYFNKPHSSCWCTSLSVCSSDPSITSNTYQTICWILFIYWSEHQWKVITGSRTPYTGAQLDLSVQRIAVCSAFSFVVYSPTEKVFVTHECTIPFHKWTPDVSIEFYENLPSGGGSWKSEHRLLCLIETISMAFSMNISWHTGTLASLLLKIMFSHFDKPRKAQNARVAAAL